MSTRSCEKMPRPRKSHCPECGTRGLEILWGEPSLPLDPGFAVGGCIYNPMIDPDFVCPDCEHEWRLDD